MADSSPRKRVAIVGSGCSGIAALWALNRTPHDVYVYEAAARLGGHTNTVDWRLGKYSAHVDTGFMIMNPATSRNFINFLRRIKVPTMRSELSFSVCRDKGAFEWASAGLDAIFCQRRNFFSPSMWRMLFDIVRFSQFAPDLLRVDTASYAFDEWESTGMYLQRHGYSDAFRDGYLIPMTAAVWNTSPRSALEYPIVTLVRFLWDHDLMSLTSDHANWLTIQNGAKSYIDAVTRGFPPKHLFLNTPVRSLTSEPDGKLRLHLDGGRSEVYDHIIIATHGDDAYSIIQSSATPLERDILSCFRTTENEAVLHSDVSLLPRSRKAWSGCNYLASSSQFSGHNVSDEVSVTYNMNVLQKLPTDVVGHVLLTLNPPSTPHPATVQGRYKYAHPVYTPETVRAQRLLSRIQNKRGISYVGAWTGQGFHEDGFISGLLAAKQHLGATLSIDLVDSASKGNPVPQVSLVGWLVRLVVWLLQVFIIEALEKQIGISRQGEPALPNGVSREDKVGYKESKLA